ncbi:MAG TPA: hypothetical protein VLM38_14965 [Blastocatellia bacterium]|nr:hypothetical protein [Blastocatellia bacterium]
MKKAQRVLLMSALILLASGLLLYYRGSQINLEVQDVDQTPWKQLPGDMWLYVGGLMVLIAGSLLLAAARIWWGRRQALAASSLSNGQEH